VLREELSKESVGVFIDASFPRGIGMGKIGGRIKGVDNPFMLHNSDSLSLEFKLLSAHFFENTLMLVGLF